MTILFFGYDERLGSALERSLSDLGELVSITPANGETAAPQASLEAPPAAAVLRQEAAGSNYVETVRRLVRVCSGIPAIGLVSERRVEFAVEAMRAGLADLVVMDGDYVERLARALLRALKSQEEDPGQGAVASPLAVAADSTLLADSLDAILGESSSVCDLKERARRVMKLDLHVLIRGETGTGKELLARAIHAGSPRRYYPFVPVNCAALPRELVEAELFGHERGAFTGAFARRVGKVMEANHGTLFLDEVGDLPAAMQAKLLRLLQEGEIQRVGADRPIVADVRVVAATNRPLELLAREGAFRSDLYHRLNAISLTLPPLRERGRDVLLVARKLLERFAAELKRPGVTMDEGAEAELLAYPWWGNFRELENVIRRTLLFSDTDVIRTFGLRSCAEMGRFTGEEHAHEDPMLDVAEGDRLVWLLRRYRGNLSRVARHLRVSRPTVYKRIHAHGLDIAAFR